MRKYSTQINNNELSLEVAGVVNQKTVLEHEFIITMDYGLHLWFRVKTSPQLLNVLPRTVQHSCLVLINKC